MTINLDPVGLSLLSVILIYLRDFASRLGRLEKILMSRRKTDEPIAEL